MKKLPIYYLIAVLPCITATVSCKKESSIKIATMQAKVDGALVICDSTVLLEEGLDGTLYGIDGFKKGGVGFMLKFPIASGVRTYQFLTYNSNFQNEGWLQYDFNNQYKSTNGSVTITEATGKKFKGTFSFTAQKYLGGTRTITEGSFEIDY
ncbi:MAG: hypothetical protein JWQ09_3654 [Segetibacter sp.]|nr:hypothetical protein [Segetibacter sp.]